MAMTPEGRVKAQLKKTLAAMGVYYFSPMSGGYARAGIADIVGCYKGKFFAFECKAGKGTPTKLQQMELAAVQQAGGLAVIINETNVDNVREILELM